MMRSRSVAVIVGLSMLTPLHAEFGVGLGVVESVSLQASARFNEALSSFHLMLAALDRKDQGAVAKYRNAASEQFKEAADLYGQASNKADNHILKATPKTQPEKEDLEYFMAHAGAYKVDVKELSQKTLLTAIANQVSQLNESMGVGNLGTLRRQQTLANSAAELQRFLTSATTVLRIG